MRRMRRVQTRPQMDTRVIWTRASLTIFTQQPSHLHHFTESETSIVKRKPSTHHMPNMFAHLTCSVPRLCFLEDVMGQSCLYLNIHSLTKASKRKKKTSFDAVVTVICIESGITGKLLHHLCLSIGVQFVKILPTHKGVSRREGFSFFIFTLGPLALLIQQNADPYTLDIDGKNNKQAFPWPNSILLTNKTTGRPTTKFQTFLTSSYRHVHVCWCACKLGVFSVCVLFWLSILLSSSGRLIKHRACQELPVAIVHWRINASGRSRALIIMPFPTYWLSLLPL